jgi:(p)ppGpp synthase/HD superfamily hydrolase
MAENVAQHPQVVLAEAIAREAHAGQVDKLGADYIDHPRRVAEQLDEPIARSAAWLHDVVEDSPISADELLRRGVDPAVVEVVVLMTRTTDVASDEYYARLAAHPIARAVKRADIADNTAPWRVAQLDPELGERLAAKYAAALVALG